MYNYSVTPLTDDHFEQRCDDIAKMVKEKTILMPLFSMSLIPEGNPVIDKVTDYVKIYAKYRDALEKRGVDCGILVQSSLGHGWKIIPNPFQRYTNLKDGKETDVCCPEDENFVNHFCDVLKILASQHPKAIMLDDDFRLMTRPGNGCACPLHMKEFNKRTGLNMTQEELTGYVYSHDDDDPLLDVYRDTQRDSMMKLAKRFREAIDSVDPSIQGINCTSGEICESVAEINRIFAGKGNPTMVRMPDGYYGPSGIRELTFATSRSAICFSKLKKGGIDIVLSETDTVPFNRYAKSASYLHMQYSSAILEGAQGAKHWLTRIGAYEPVSGKAYREILSKNYGLYEKLSEYSKTLSWVGCAQIFTEMKKMPFNNGKAERISPYAWTIKVLERMGIPFYFSEDAGDAAFLGADIVSGMDDDKIKELFNSSVFIDGECAKLLTERGFSNLLGVKAETWDLGPVSGECFDIENRTCCGVQPDMRKLTPVCDGVEVISQNYLKNGWELKPVSPAVTVYRRENGKITVVYCGSPDAPQHYAYGFAFLNESRKNQFIKLLKEAGALPIYCVGDDEICLRSAMLSDGRLMAYAAKIGIDELNSLKIYLDKAPKAVSMLDCSGREQPVEFEELGDNVYEIKQRLETMCPLVLLIEY